MCSARISLEVETFDEFSLIRISFLFWYPLGNQISIVVGAEHRIALRQFPENFVIVAFINPDASTFALVLDLCLLDKRLDEVFDVALLVDEDIICIL